MDRRSKVTSAAVVISLFLTVTLAHGFDEKQFQKFRKSNNCEKCDLSGAKLSGRDLSYAELASANLSGADLSNATLYSANLSGANLGNANLSGANLYDANLTKADLKGAILGNANLTGATWTDGRKCKQGSTGTCK